MPDNFGYACIIEMRNTEVKIAEGNYLPKKTPASGSPLTYNLENVALNLELALGYPGSLARAPQVV
jgi:hypothetical protein